MRGMILATVVAFSMTACGKGEKAAPAPPPPAPKTTYECAAMIQKKVGPPVSGEATGKTEAETTAAAWKAACAKLPAADQADCKDSKKWESGISGGSVTSNHKTTFTETVTLTQVAPQLTGHGKSQADEASACKEALADACKQAGVPGDCVASGAYVSQGQSTSKTTTM